MKKVNVSVAGEKGVLFKIKKGELLQLYNTLSELKIGGVSKDGLFAILNTKIALAPVIKKIGEVSKLAAEELKSVDADKDDKKALEKLTEFMNRHLEEDVPLSLPHLSKDDLYAITKDNHIEVYKAEILNKLLVR